MLGIIRHFQCFLYLNWWVNSYASRLCLSVQHSVSWHSWVLFRLICNISETTLSGCYREATAGIYFWTAGQRIDPSRNSTFVWRVTSTDTYSDTVSVMSYTNWYTARPNYYGSSQACMMLWSGNSYTWNDYYCSHAMCSVCELDI